MICADINADLIPRIANIYLFIPTERETEASSAGGESGAWLHTTDMLRFLLLRTQHAKRIQMFDRARIERCVSGPGAVGVAPHSFFFCFRVRAAVVVRV